MHQDVMMNFTRKSKLSKSSSPGMKLYVKESEHCGTKAKDCIFLVY